VCVCAYVCKCVDVQVRGCASACVGVQVCLCVPMCVCALVHACMYLVEWLSKWARTRPCAAKLSTCMPPCPSWSAAAPSSPPLRRLLLPNAVSGRRKAQVLQALPARVSSGMVTLTAPALAPLLHAPPSAL